MDETLKLILEKLTGLEQGQAKLEQGQAKLEQGMVKLEQRQSNLEQSFAELEKGQNEIKEDVKEIKEAVHRIELDQPKDIVAMLDRMNKNFDDKSEALNKRVFKVETEIERLKRQ